MGIVEFQDVSFTYDGVSRALDNLSLDIKKGEFVAILGSNGSGKSTLARCVDALLIPDKGRVLVLEVATNDPAETFFIRSHAGLVFQNPDDQIVASIVEADVAFGPENLGADPEEIEVRVKQALEQVGLAGFEQRHTHELSGGQKQRVALAGVLAMHPDVIVLDEASAMLDPQGREGLLRLCKRLNTQGYTILMITHFVEEAVDVDRVVALSKGAVALDGAPSVVLADRTTLNALSLKATFSVNLASLLNERGIPVSAEIDSSRLASEIRSRLSEDAAKEWRIKDVIDPAKNTTDDFSVSTSPLLRFENVSFAYNTSGKTLPESRGIESHEGWGSDPDDKWALKDISFCIPKGSYTAIAGHTGSGKSTLLQLCNGLLQPSQGRVLFKGTDLTSKKERNTVLGSIGLVFQYPERQLFAATVAEDVGFGPRNLGCNSGEVERRVKQSLELVGLDYEELKERSPFSLSGGQQRRVALAGVLAMEPQTLILDEPAAGLDPQAHTALMQLITALHKEQGITIIMASHNMDDIATYADYMLVLNRGEKLFEDTPFAVFQHPEQLKGIGLGIPTIWDFVSKLGLAECFERIPTIEELADTIAALVAPLES